MTLRGFRFQTGEIKEVVQRLKNDEIVQMDIDEEGELDEVVKDLQKYSIYKIKDMPYDYKALDGVKEPEFEMRVGFYSQPVDYKDTDKEKIMYIDFFTVQEEETTYGEIL